MVGWNAARAISEIEGIDECHVVTHVDGKDALEEEERAGRSATLRFHYFGDRHQCHPNRLLARLQSWKMYRSWQVRLPRKAKDLHRRHDFALVHHITYATWRAPSRLWRLPIPFVFGPVGGGSRIPRKFMSMLGTSACAFELFRDTATFLAANSKALKLCCTRSAAVVAADRSTAGFLTKHGAESVQTLCQVFFTQEQICRFTQRKKPMLRDGSELRIFAGGNLEGRKGTTLTLQALARLKRSGVPFKYVYGGGGPDRNSMLNLSRYLCIADRVLFHNGFAGADYEDQLGGSDVYLLPSVRETAGITMMEAILSGCYPIVLAGTGAGDIVENTGGAAIQADSPDEAVDKIARQLQWCYHHRAEMRSLAAEAALKMRNLYSEDAYKKSITEIYAAAIARHRLKV